MTTPRDEREAASTASAGPRSPGQADPDTSYGVTVTRDDLVFSSGHFITYDAGGQCEALHGHNYRVGVTLHGDVNEDAYVYDFVALKARMRELVDALDHRMLLPRDNPDLELREEEGGVSVAYGDRRYLFPERDVVILPVPNTTAEMLAEYLLDRLADDLRREGGSGVVEAAIEVEESFGQSATARRSLRPEG